MRARISPKMRARISPEMRARTSPKMRARTSPKMRADHHDRGRGQCARLGARQCARRGVRRWVWWCGRSGVRRSSAGVQRCGRWRVRRCVRQSEMCQSPACRCTARSARRGAETNVLRCPGCGASPELEVTRPRPGTAGSVEMRNIANSWPWPWPWLSRCRSAVSRRTVRGRSIRGPSRGSRRGCTRDCRSCRQLRRTRRR
jgi:hypothetical protein